MDSLAATELSQALRPIAARAAELGISWILIGAAGRDLIFGQVRGLVASRATKDVDIAIQVETWGEWSSLRKALIEKDGARPHSGAKQRLILPGEAHIDLVPFGDIEEDGIIEWPPDSNPIMNVRGFREAHEHSVPIHLPGPLQVFVPTVETYLCLKLFAWHDRHVEQPRHDSADLADLMNHADEFITLEELYDNYPSAMEESESDPTRGALQAMGQRLRDVLLPVTRLEAIRLLEREVDEDGHLELLRELGSHSECLERLQALLRGLSDPR